MRLLKLLTLLLALSSPAALLVATRVQPPTTLAADAARPSMHYAYVRMHGGVVGFPATEAGRLSFWLFDGTGAARVILSRPASEALVAQKKAPAPGDRVTVEGSVRVDADEVRLLVSAAHAVRAETPPARPIPLSDLARAPGGARVEIGGQVRQVRHQRDGYAVVTLRAGEATGEVVFAPSLWLPPVGEWVAIRGGVDDRGATRRLAVSRAEDVRLGDPRPPAPTPIRALSRRMLGRWVAVQGQVYDLRPFDAGMRVLVQDASGGVLAVVIPDPLWYALPLSQTLVIGDAFWAQGELSQQRSQLELLPELPEDLRADPLSP